MENRKQPKRIRTWYDWIQLVVALLVPLTIVTYTVIQNNTEISIAQKNRKQDLEIADERHQQDISLSHDEQEEAALVHYFDSLGKLLEQNEKLQNQTHIARFKTLTALAQLKSKRKGFLIRSLIETNLIIMRNGLNAILDLSFADLTGLDLTDNMLDNNQMKCAILSYTTLTNASFRRMGLHGSTFRQTHLVNSDFSSSYNYLWSCGSGNRLGVNFRDAVLEDSIFDDASYVGSSFPGSLLNRARMRRFKCLDCTFLDAEMNSMDLSGAQFSSDLAHNSVFQKINMSSTVLYKTKFVYADFAQSRLTMVNATETIFQNSQFTFAYLKNNFFIQTIISNSSFYSSSLTGSLWYEAKINYTSFEKADMTYVNFINSECHYCVFNQTQLTGTNFTNSSLDGSDFRGANVNYKQLIAARSLQDVILPDGTIIESMNNKYL